MRHKHDKSPITEAAISLTSVITEAERHLTFIANQDELHCRFATFVWGREEECPFNDHPPGITLKGRFSFVERPDYSEMAARRTIFPGRVIDEYPACCIEDAARKIEASFLAAVELPAPIPVGGEYCWRDENSRGIDNFGYHTPLPSKSPMNRVVGCSSCNDRVHVTIGDTEGWSCFGCSPESGYVYVLTNPVYDAVKVGYTNRTAEERREELSDQTACPAPFEVAASFQSQNPEKLERELHRRLQSRRVSKHREFFDCGVSDVRQAVADVRGVEKEGVR